MARPYTNSPLAKLDSWDNGAHSDFHTDEKELDVEEYSIQSSTKAPQVIGSSDLLDENGNIRLIPMPTANPKDPLNLAEWRKWTAIGVLCFFASLALSAEIVIGHMTPIFLLEYAGLDPRMIKNIDFVAASGGKILHLNPLAVIPHGVKPPSLEGVAKLATIPLVTNGIASYFLVPLSIAIGRRPVLLVSAVLAWGGGFWAGVSTSLESHLIARAVMGLGAGCVEALIPLIVQDLVFVHQRSKAQAAVITSQGFIIIGLGISAPWVAANYSWRYLYFATSGLGIVAWILLCAFLPETRWTRSNEMLAGQPEAKLAPGETRPKLDYARYGCRTLWTDIGVFHCGFEWKNAAISMLDTLKTTLFPAVLWSVAANTVLLVTVQASQQLSAFALLAQGWQYQWVGLSVLPFVLATALTFVVAGPLAARVTTAVARRRGGVREAEFGLLNMLLPFATGIAGCFVFGFAGEAAMHWAALLLGLFLLLFSFLCILVTINVFVVESYPQWAGPVLVNVSSLRIIIAFFFASQATTWVKEKGLLPTFALYAEAMIFVLLFMPLLYFFGKKVRIYTAGKIKSSGPSGPQSRWSR